MNKKTVNAVNAIVVALTLVSVFAALSAATAAEVPASQSTIAGILPMYRVTDLGVLPGFVDSIATAIDRNGDVTGYCDAQKNERAGRQGFVYSNGKMTPVAPILSGKDWSEPHGLNSSLTVAGDLGHGTQVDGFRLEGGQLQLPLIGGPAKIGSVVTLTQLKPYLIDNAAAGGYHVTRGHINCINEAGTMGGVVEIRTRITLPNGHWANIEIQHAGVIHALVGGKFSFEDLGALGGKFSSVNAITSTGLLAGSAELAPDATGAILPHACLFDHGKTIDLGTLGGPVSEAFGVNDHGDVVGDSANASQSSRAFLWHDGKMIDLGDIGGGISEGVAINDAGVVVGRSYTPEIVQHAFVYLNGKMHDLNECIAPSSGWGITDARAINDRGQIAATAAKNGESHAVILTPISGR